MTDPSSDVDWQPYARRLADRLAHSASRWYEPIASTARHLLVPRWFAHSQGVWSLREGADDHDGWMQAAYNDPLSLVTQVGSLHADHATPDQHPVGLPGSSSTNPRLVMHMYRHAHIHDGCEVLDVGTGSGYGCGILARRLGDSYVTSIDIDPYLTKVAAERLSAQGVAPRIATVDATGELDWEGDRIVSMVAVRAIPASWLAGLRTGGRLVTSIAGTSIIITARKTADGGASGTVEWDRAGFMKTRRVGKGPSQAESTPLADETGGETSAGRYPVIDVANAREIHSVLELAVPGIDHRFEQDQDGLRTARMTHPDGSWAKATGGRGESPKVRQGGPRRLWDVLEGIRSDWLADGNLHIYGAEVRIDPDGTSHFSRGSWHATIA